MFRVRVLHLRSPITIRAKTSGPGFTLDAKLRRDVKKLGAALGDVIKEKDKPLFESVEMLRRLARQWRNPQDDSSAFEKIVSEVKAYDADRLLGLSRAFTHFLALSNTAETSHRIRRLREQIISSELDIALPPKEDSVYGSIKTLVKNKVEKDKIYNALCNQSVEIVLTAHPTEVNRRTILQKHHRIKDILQSTDRGDLLAYEQREMDSKLHREIISIWESDELRRSKPTPIDEAKAGLAVVENVLWHALPEYIRKLDDVCRHELGSILPPNIAPIKIASWMGGDRDGNPNVTAATTRQVVFLSRWMAATLFRKDIQDLREELSLRIATPELLKLSGQVTEPYRVVLTQLRTRLEATIDFTNSMLNTEDRITTVRPITDIAEILDPLMVIYRSLMESGYERAARGNLTDTIRRAAAFGLSLSPLDLRQESNRHTEALTAITNYLGLGSYESWSEEERRSWLRKELASKRPLLPRGR
jgi:phosphoenolpyruvate carboxylase